MPSKNHQSLKRPRIELLGPDLDLRTPFIPGYDLSSKDPLPCTSKLSAPQISAIALALWELTGEPSPNCSSHWTLGRDKFYRGA